MPLARFTKIPPPSLTNIFPRLCHFGLRDEALSWFTTSPQIVRSNLGGKNHRRWYLFGMASHKDRLLDRRLPYSLGLYIHPLYRPFSIYTHPLQTLLKRQDVLLSQVADDMVLYIDSSLLRLVTSSWPCLGRRRLSVWLGHGSLHYTVFNSTTQRLNISASCHL